MEFKFPDVGEGITEGEIVKWLVKEGDIIKQDQIVAEIETDKAIVQIPSPQPGKIMKLHHKEGDTIHVGEILLTVGSENEILQPQKNVEELPSPMKSGVVGELEEATEIMKMPEKKELKNVLSEIMAMPATRRLAKDLGVDLSDIKGSGKDGRITEEDVRKHAENAEPDEKQPQVLIERKYDFYGHIERVPVKGIRKSTAKKMSESVLHAAQVTTMDWADVTELSAIREKQKIDMQKIGVKLTFIPFVLKALVHALKDHPYLNSEYDEEHDVIVLKRYYNIGIAVDIEGQGLMVPVVKGADAKSMIEIAKDVERLAKQASERSLDIGDLKGGTFTITNVGSIGGIFATPVINYPECAILLTGKIKEMPVVEAGEVTVKKMMPLSLTFDHRIVDGAEAQRFLNALIKHLENPYLMLVDRD